VQTLVMNINIYKKRLHVQDTQGVSHVLGNLL
jgi:hypothetical protein